MKKISSHGTKYHSSADFIRLLLVFKEVDTTFPDTTPGRHTAGILHAGTMQICWSFAPRAEIGIIEWRNELKLLRYANWTNFVLTEIDALFKERLLCMYKYLRKNDKATTL